jgi:uncharacterized protein (DUF488 family)
VSGGYDPAVDAPFLTLGLAARELPALLGILERAAVRTVADVRRWPTAARFPHHAAPGLHEALRARGFAVLDLGDLLGGDRPGGYARHMATGGFRKGIDALLAAAADGRVALLCAEADPDRCHRRFVADALRARGAAVADHRDLPRRLRLVRRP